MHLSISQYTPHCSINITHLKSQDLFRGPKVRKMAYLEASIPRATCIKCDTSHPDCSGGRLDRLGGCKSYDIKKMRTSDLPHLALKFLAAAGV